MGRLNHLLDRSNPCARDHRSDWFSRKSPRLAAIVSAWLIVAVCALVAPGCEEETRNVGKRPETRALDQTGVAVGLDENPRAATPKPSRLQNSPGRSSASGPRTFATPARS